MKLVMCRLGLGLKPRLGLCFARLGLHKIMSPAKSQKAGLAGPGSGSSLGLYRYEANNIHHHNINMYYYSSPSEPTVIKRLSHPIVLYYFDHMFTSHVTSEKKVFFFICLKSKQNLLAISGKFFPKIVN